MIKRFLPTLVIFLLGIIIAIFYLNKNFSLHFVDEEENIAAGKYLISGDKLYKDLVINHQPIPYILSYTVQKLSNPSNIQLVLKRHREAIIGYSLIWIILLTGLTGWKSLLFILFYEVSKILLLGNLFLAETFAVYPLVYLVVLIFNKERVSKYQMLFAGMLLTFCIFLLAPLWPLCFTLFLLVILKKTGPIKKNLILIIFGSLPIVIIIKQFISIPGYFDYALISNIKYTIPITSYFGPWYSTTFKGFMAIFIAFLPVKAPTLTLWLIRSLSVILLTNLIVLIGKKKYFQAILIFVTLGLANIRYYPPGLEYYQGFHLLPWYGLLIYLSTTTLYEIYSLTNRNWIKLLLFFELFTCFIPLSLIFKTKLLPQRNSALDYYINYSSQESYGTIIKIMRSSNDTIFVYPDYWLIYWLSDTKHGQGTFGYYPVLSNSPAFEANVVNVFTTIPPTFLYCENCPNTRFNTFLSPYTQVTRDGQNTPLYITKAKVKTLTEEQKGLVKYYQYDLE